MSIQPIDYNKINSDAISKDAELDASFGLQSILKVLYNITLMKKADLIFDSVIINAMTMVRNNVEKDRDNTTIANKIQNDLMQLINYFTQYVTSPYIRPYIDNPYIVIYKPENYRLPKVNRRALTDTNQRISDLTERFFKDVCTHPTTVKEMETFTLYGIKVGVGDFPHKEVYKFIHDKANLNSKKLSTRRYLLVSHVPMDFHLAQYLKGRLLLLESYTGALKSLDMFGEKVFNGEKGIPFNQYTHLLFGDKINVLQMLWRKDKKRMIEIAQKNNWMIKPLASIKSDIKNSNLVEMGLLTAVTF